MKQHKLEWFKKRIGKHIFRTSFSCPCDSCKKVGEVGLFIADELHANYLFDCQNDLQLYYFDIRKPDSNVIFIPRILY